MYALKELKKASKRTIEGEEIRIAVLGNCATQFFSAAVQGCAKLSGLNVNLFDADYNQIEAQLIDLDSEVCRFLPDNIILWLATDKLYEEFLDLAQNERSHFADILIKKLQTYWDLIAAHTHARIIQPNFTEIDDKVLGQYSCKTEGFFTYQIRKLNFLLEEAMSKNPRVYPVDLLALQIQLGQERFYDPVLYYHAKMSISLDALPFVAKAVTDVLQAIYGKMKKCVVLDLDNTLWGGLIGDDGLGGIEIGELGRGHAFTNFQRWLKQLKECGIILAVCSKNNEETAKEPFERHEEMVLRLSDISVFVANWEDKASNIRRIQEILNIGMDSMVFLDDNPFERSLVRQMIPEIEVPELPKDPARYLDFLQQCNYFETASYSGEAADRTKQYQAEFARRESKRACGSLDEYLQSLDMVGGAKPFEPLRYARIAQLTQRSNQFNLRTVRYTEDEIARLAEDDRYFTLCCTLKDRFGDHGLVGVVIMEKVSSSELFISTWLMSCRVLKRGMEEFMINAVFRTAREHGFSMVSAEYIPTPKNKMVKDIYKTMGFKETEENRYCLAVKDYQEKQEFIREETENGKISGQK